MPTFIFHKINVSVVAITETRMSDHYQEDRQKDLRLSSIGAPASSVKNSFNVSICLFNVNRVIMSLQNWINENENMKEELVCSKNETGYWYKVCLSVWASEGDNFIRNMNTWTFLEYNRKDQIPLVFSNWKMMD